jgi:hypothetical protein
VSMPAMYSMPNGGQADVTMLGVSAEGAGLTKENFNFFSLAP